jgi:hypothetical protein
VAPRRRLWQQGASDDSVEDKRMRKPAATLLMLAIVLALATPPTLAADQAPQPQTQPVRTGKERLSSKAADEQRIDNCKVPVALRGPTPRPDDCRHEARQAPTQ